MWGPRVGVWCPAAICPASTCYHCVLRALATTLLAGALRMTARVPGSPLQSSGVTTQALRPLGEEGSAVSQGTVTHKGADGQKDRRTDRRSPFPLALASNNPFWLQNPLSCAH